MSAGRIPAEAVVPSTRRSDSIRLDLPLGGLLTLRRRFRPVKDGSGTRE